MANTVSLLSYANTFGDWVVTTNALVKENNNLATNNYTKLTGTLVLSDPSESLRANGPVNFYNTLQILGPGSSAYVQNNLTVSGQISSQTITIIQGVDNTQNTNISSTDGKMQSAYSQANTGIALAQASSALAQASFNQANTGTTLAQASFNQANTGIALAQASFNQANTGTTLAQASFNKANSVVISITGTTNQVTANVSTGNVLLSLPQSINTGANVQFASFGVGTAASGTSGEIRAINNITAFYSSDRKFKENIQDIPNALETVDAIGGKLFDWTDAYLEAHGGEDDYFNQKSDFGVIAQDVQSVFPTAVRTRPDGSLAVDYEKLVALAFAAIKELSCEIKELKKK